MPASGKTALSISKSELVDTLLAAQELLPAQKQHRKRQRSWYYDCNNLQLLALCETLPDPGGGGPNARSRCGLQWLKALFTASLRLNQCLLRRLGSTLLCSIQ